MNGIGQTLKEAREKKGLTLDDLQQTTKIQKRYLIAIEAENFDALPGDFYVRAFIQQYAKVVDLDGDELLAQLEEKTGIKTETPVAHETTTRTEAVRIEQAEKNDFLGKLMNYLPTIIIVIVVVAILGTIYVVAWGNHSKNTESQSSSSQTVSVSSDVKKKKSSASTSSAKKPQVQKRRLLKRSQQLQLSKRLRTFLQKVQNSSMTLKMQRIRTNWSFPSAAVLLGAPFHQTVLKYGKGR